jgi:hypothetical protein
MSNVIQLCEGAADFTLSNSCLCSRSASSPQKANKNRHNSTGNRGAEFAITAQRPTPVCMQPADLRAILDQTCGKPWVKLRLFT